MPAPLQYSKPVLLYDGVCNLCSGMVKFVIRHDPQSRFYFASLQSAIGQKLAAQYGVADKDMDTFVLIHDGKASVRSTAALHLFRNMGLPWSIFYMLMVVPRVVRDAVYRFVSRNRYRWFGKKDSCMVPTPDIKSRFLDWEAA